MSACVAVEQLWLGCNNIAALEPIADLPKLRRLSAYDNPITSVACLRAAKALQRPDLDGTRVIDFSPLLDIPTLWELNLANYTQTLYDAQIEEVTLSARAQRATDTAETSEGPKGPRTSTTQFSRPTKNIALR